MSTIIITGKIKLYLLIINVNNAQEIYKFKRTKYKNVKKGYARYVMHVCQSVISTNIILQ